MLAEGLDFISRNYFAQKGDRQGGITVKLSKNWIVDLTEASLKKNLGNASGILILRSFNYNSVISLRLAYSSNRLAYIHQEPSQTGGVLVHIVC